MDKSIQLSNAGKLYGIVTLEEPIIFLEEALGSLFLINIGGVAGRLALPGIPDWEKFKDDPVRAPLSAPENAMTWRQGSSQIRWGCPNEYPVKNYRVEKFLLEFDVHPSDENVSGTRIHKSYNQWRKLLLEYFELLSKQWLTAGKTEIVGTCNDLDLFSWSDSGKQVQNYEAEPVRFSMFLNMHPNALSALQFNDICAFASGGIELVREQSMQLDAYRAYSAGDYRKAVIETAVASEIALTNAIQLKFDEAGISYGHKLINKFRMLSGRLELARILQISLPNIDMTESLVEPRNNVIHKAVAAEASVALKAIKCTDELLHCLNLKIRF